MASFDLDDPAIAAVIDEALAAPPATPRDPNLFSSNPLFGEPGIYPEGTPMEPASGGPPNEATARRLLERILDERGDRRGRARNALARYDRAPMRLTAPDPLARAALCAGHGTIAADVLHQFPGRGPVQRLGVGALASAGRVVGPSAADDIASHRLINERYQGEHPALIAPSLAHDLLWTPDRTDHTSETLLHALVAAVHVQSIAASPWLAHLGTELARRQNSLAITLLNSRAPGSARISLIAPDGPGTIPGGAPGMQSPDFWSIPFGPETTEPVTSLSQFYASDPARHDPNHPERDAVATFARLFDLGEIIDPLEQLRANVALGLVDPEPIVASCNQLRGPLARAMAVWPT